MISVKVSLSQLTYGGPSTFVNRFSKYLKNKNISLNFYNSKEKASVILVISGTKKLGWLLYHKLIGTRIIQRLDGFEWKYNYESHSIGYSIKCKLINFNMNLIRKYLSDHIVYQSLYLEQEWNNKFGKSNKSFSVIHNSADDIFFNKQSKRIDRSSKDQKYKTLLNVAVPSGMWQNAENIICNDEDRKYLRKIRKEYKNLVRNIWNPFDKNHEKILGCTTVNRIYVTPIGDVLVCPYVHIKIGNIFEKPLKEIIDYGFRIKHFRNHSDLCLAGEDKEFIKKYMTKSGQTIFKPALAKDIFSEDDFAK